MEKFKYANWYTDVSNLDNSDLDCSDKVIEVAAFEINMVLDAYFAMQMNEPELRNEIRYAFLAEPCDEP